VTINNHQQPAPPINYDRDFAWQRAYVPEMKRILGEHLIGEAPMYEDRNQNTDLVLELGRVRVACRVRRHRDLARFGAEFTIRSKRPAGTRTELHKVIQGWGDYILYGFAAAEGATFAQWLLGDLGHFRIWHSYEMARRHGELPGTLVQNRDGTEGRAYRIQDLPPEFVAASFPAPAPTSWARAA
jgi:hypothetical protein